MRLKTKERKKKGRKKFQEGRGKKPKMQTCLNSQVIRKVKKVKTKQKKTTKKVIYNESTLTKTLHHQSVSIRCFHIYLIVGN